jgi:hypothetical protein
MEWRPLRDDAPGSMVVEGETPLGAPAVPEGGRDRLSVWVARHGWAVPALRIVVGLGLFAASALLFGTHLPVVKVVAFVVGTSLGGKAGEREKERGDSILETVFAGGYLPPPPEAVPSEFAEYVPRPPDPRNDPRLGGRMG